MICMPNHRVMLSYRLNLLAALLICTWATVTHAEIETGAMFVDCPECPEMIVIPAGSFIMGSNTGEKDERPAHRVTISKPFAMSRTEITQVQWRAVMQDQWQTISGKNPSFFSSCGDNCPVEQISWNDAQIFIQKINAITRKQYRLPSEAEWEYACRANTKQQFCGSDDINSVAWHNASVDELGNNIQGTAPVAGKQANNFGLYDMSGNVWEWVEDSYHDNFINSPTNGDAWQSDGKRRVLRGGSWFNGSALIKATRRFKEMPTSRSKFYGLRLVRVLP